MCRGIHYIHAGCNHIKKIYLVESCNTVNGIPCNNIHPRHIIPVYISKIKAPALCVRCFRQKEATIDTEYETIKRDLESEITRVDECLRTGFRFTERTSAAMQHYRSECMDNILHAQAARDSSIRRFREDQGVWGDG